MEQMPREEKRRKFHDAVLNTLYPPPPPPPESQEDEQKPVTVTTSIEGFDVDLIPDDYGVRQSESSSSEDDGDGDAECGAQKLTRAQRKRLRNKKLKEDVSRRRKIIGPLLPLSSDNDVDGDCGGAIGKDRPNVRRNAHDSDSPSAATNQRGEPPGAGGRNQSKLKQRRTAKRLAKEKLKSSNGETCDQDQNLSSFSVGSCEKDN